MCHIMILASLFASISNPNIENYASPDLTPIRVRAQPNQDAIEHPPTSGLNKIKSLVQTLQSTSLSAPQSNSIASQNQKPINNEILLVNHGQTQHILQSLNGSHFKKFPGDYIWLNSNTIVNKQDRSIAVLVTTCSSLITMMLIYGILYNKPSYLMPYFSIKVFQVVITCITTLGFYSTLPDIKLWLKTQSSFMPFRESFLTLDRQTLELFVFAIFLMTILVKLYVVITVWYCYRHMMMLESYRNQTLLHLRSMNNGCIGRTSMSNADDNNNGYKIDDESLMVNGMGLPPKYEDIIKQIKQESLITARANNNSNVINITNTHPTTSNALPTTSANISVLNTVSDDDSSHPVEQSSNLLSKTQTVAEPPSYLSVAHTNNIL